MKLVVALLLVAAVVAYDIPVPPTTNTCVGTDMQKQTMMAVCIRAMNQTLPPCPVWPPGVDMWREYCCPKCWRYPECQTDPSTIPLCAQGQFPKMQANGCLDCRLNPDMICNADDKAACLAKVQSTDFPVCAPGTVPLPDGHCCVTCRPALNPNCNDSSIQACQANWQTLRECAAGEESEFDPAVCCRTCRPAPPPPPPIPGGKCTVDEIAQCLKSVPTCGDEEHPAQDATKQCCPTCARPERNCTLDKIVDCMEDVRDCAPGEVPAHAAGEKCCPTCKPPMPTCPNCVAPKICIPTPTTPVCVDVTTVAIRLKALTDKARMLLANYTGMQIEFAIREMVNRFCDQNVNKATCAKYAYAIRAFKLEVAQRLTDSVDINIAVGEPPATPAGRAPSHHLAAFFRGAVSQTATSLFATGGASLVAGATVDADANAGMFTASNSAASVAISLFALLALLFVALL